MTKYSMRIVWWMFLLVATGLPLSARPAQTAETAESAQASADRQNSALAHGASATLLPSGELLLLGGQDAHGAIQNRAAIQDLSTGAVTPITGMHFARVYHSATVLPDGTVLVLGGIGAGGKIVTEAESFNPETKTFSAVSSAPSARAFHTATLLTDGRLLIVGGVSPDNRLVRALELWDPRHPAKSSVVSSPLELKTARRNHTATLLADGRVLLSGGKDEKGHGLTTGELFDPGSQSTSTAENPRELLAPSPDMTEVRATSPEDQAVDVPVDALLSLRFSRAVLISSIGAETLILEGPAGRVDAKIVPAEGGMLAFMTPGTALVPGTTYSVKLSGAVDTANKNIAFAQFTFTTAGIAPGNGPGAGDGLWIPTTDWKTHLPDSPAQTLPPLEAAKGTTAVSGQVLSLNGKPLAHVTFAIDNRHVQSDETGRFLLTNVPAGHQVLVIDGATANRHDRSYGYFEFGVELKAGTTHVLSFTIWMPLLDTAHAVTIPSPTTKETVVSNPLIPGLEVHFPAGTVIYGSDHKVVKQVTITPVPLDRTPFPLPLGVPVPIYFTLQPGGAYIEVHGSPGAKGGQLYYPNSSHLSPGAASPFGITAPTMMAGTRTAEAL